MKNRSKLVCLLLLGASPLAGYAVTPLQRGDRVTRLVASGLPLDPASAEEALFVLGTSDSGLDRARCLTLLSELRERYPATLRWTASLASEARYLFYAGEYSPALETYRRIVSTQGMEALSPRDRLLEALAMIRCGFTSEPRGILESVAADRGVGARARFYLAWLDYSEDDLDAALAGWSALGDPAADPYLAQIHYRKGDYADAARLAAAVAQRDPDAEQHAEMLRVEGLSLVRMGDVAAGRQCLGRYLDEGGTEAQALHTLGAILYDEGDYDRALSLFDRITGREDALGQSAWLYAGQCNLRIPGNEDAAAMAFDAAVRLPYDDSVTETALYNFAVATARGGRSPFSRGISELERFTSRFPGSRYAPEVERHLAAVYFNNREYERALESIERVGSNDRDTRERRQRILLHLGAAQLSRGDAAAAESTFAKVGDDPDRSIGTLARLWAGEAQSARGRYSEAVRSYTKALARNPDPETRARALYGRGYAGMKLGRYADAATDFGGAAAGALDSGRIADARLRQADALYYAGNYTAARAIYEREAAQNASETSRDYATLRRATIAGVSGDTDGKIRLLEEIAWKGSSPWSGRALHDLAECYALAGRTADAERAYRRLIDAHPDAADPDETLLALAKLKYDEACGYERIPDPARALKAWLELEQTAPADYAAEIAAGVMHNSEDPAQRAQYARRLAELPGTPPELQAEARFHEAEALIEAGDTASGRRIMEALAGSTLRHIGSWQARAAVTLATMMLEEGDAGGAEKILTELTDSDVDDAYWLARGYIALSDVLAAQGKSALARQYLTTLQANYPGNEKDILKMISTRLQKLR